MISNRRNTILLSSIKVVSHLSNDHYGRGTIPRVSQASPSAKNWALGKANLPRVLHSGKNSTRRREALPSAAECLALGKEWHSAKALFPECNTRGRAALGKEKCYLMAHPPTPLKTFFPECLPWHSAKRLASPSALSWHSAKGLFAECQGRHSGKKILKFELFKRPRMEKLPK